MKKAYFKTKIILAFCLAISLATLAFSCSKPPQPQHTSYYTPDNFITLSNFSLRTNQEENTIIHYSNDKSKILFHSSKSTKTQPIDTFFVFGTSVSQQLVDGVWQEVSQSNVPAHLRVIRDKCGLVFTNIQRQFITETSANKFAVDAEHLFMSAFREHYEHFFGKAYSESEFLEDFHSTAPALYGSFGDYAITLDCSQQDHIRLAIVKNSTDTEKGFRNEFDYFDIDKTQIKLPLPPLEND